MAAAWQRVAALAVAGLLYISALLHRVEAQCGGFSNSCPVKYMWINTSNGVLNANCKNNAGNNVLASIDLNRYLGNDNANLRVPGSGFMSSCAMTSTYLDSSPGSSSAYFSVACKNNQGNRVIATYDVNRNIANLNGNLVWNQCRRRALLISDDKVLDDSSLEGTRKALFT